MGVPVTFLDYESTRLKIFFNADLLTIPLSLWYLSILIVAFQELI